MSTLTTTVRHSIPAQWIVAAVAVLVAAAVAVTLTVTLSGGSSSSSHTPSGLSGSTTCTNIPGTNVSFC